MQNTRIVTSRCPWRRAGLLGGAALMAGAVGLIAAESQTATAPEGLGVTDRGAVQHWLGRLPKGAVWVVNRDQGSLTIFDAATGAVLGAVPEVGAGAHDICLSEHAGKAFITAETANAVAAVDLETLAVDVIPVGPLPHHCEPSHDGRTIYVSLASHTPAVGAPLLAEVDADDFTVEYIPTSANPAARAHAPRPSPDGDTIYVAHDVGNQVTGVDVESGDLAFNVAPPIPRAEEVIATRFGDWLWVSSRGDGTVKRIDLESGAITRVVAVAVEPESVMLAPSERTLAVSLRGSPATLALVDTARLSLLASVPIAPTAPCGDVTNAPSFGDLAVMSRDGRHVFATFDRGAGCEGGVSVIDVRTRQVVATWPYPGKGRTHGIGYTRRKPRF